MNVVIISGNLGADPDVKVTNSGKAMVKFRVAVDRSYYAEGGAKISATDWFQVVVWDSQAESCAKYLQKGSKVVIRGSLRPREWKDEQNVDHRIVEINAESVEFAGKTKSQDQVETSA